MKTFSFRGYAASGARMQGLIEALDLKDAREKLAERGTLAEVVRPVSDPGGWGRGGRFGLNERSAFYRELGALLRAGVPAVPALDLLLASRLDARTSGILASVRDRIREGAPFAEALPQVADTVSDFEIALLQTGQRTGQLGVVLEQMADYLDDQHRLREGLVSALLYPVLVIALALVIGLVMITAVLPRLAGLFAETGVHLPALTRALIWLGQDGRVPALALLLLALAGGVWGARLALRPAHRQAVEQRLHRVPFLRRGLQLLVSFRFARTLAILLRGGVPLVDGLPLAGRATGSRWLDHEIRAGIESVRHGRSVSNFLVACPWIGSVVPAWYQAGEASGDVPGLLEQAARRFQAQWELTLQRFIRLVEPALILIVGLGVLVIALAILQPVLSLNQMAR